MREREDSVIVGLVLIIALGDYIYQGTFCVETNIFWPHAP